jgi:hypothetical protein
MYTYTHGPFGHLYLRMIMMVLASVVATSFAILLLFSPLMPPPLRHPIFGRGHGSRRLLPVFVRHQPRHRPAQWLLHVHEDVSQHVCTIVFAVIGRLIRLLGLRPVLPPQPATPAHGRGHEPMDAHRRGYGGESVLLLAFLRACSRGGHGGAHHPLVILAMRSPGLRYWKTKPRSAAVADICYGVGGGVVSPRWVQG